MEAILDTGRTIISTAIPPISGIDIVGYHNIGSITFKLTLLQMAHRDYYSLLMKIHSQC